MGRSAFAGGFLGGLAWSVARRFPWWMLVAAPIFLLAVARSAWIAAEPWQRALAVAVAVGLLGLWVWSRWGKRRPRRAAAPARMPRTTGEMFWVYVLREWRDRDGRIIPLRDAHRHPEPISHLVYVGYTHDIEQRLEQHAADKSWFHDDLWLDPRTHWYGSEDVARSTESWLIDNAARSPHWNEWPRENWVGNPRREECRRLSEQMRERAFAA